MKDAVPKTLLAQLAYFVNNGWIQGQYGLIITQLSNNEVVYHVYRTTVNDQYVRDFKTSDKEKAFASYAYYEWVIKTRYITGSSMRSFDKIEMQLTDVQRVAIDVLEGDPIAIDMLRDVMERGQ